MALGTARCCYIVNDIKQLWIKFNWLINWNNCNFYTKFTKHYSK